MNLQSKESRSAVLFCFMTTRHHATNVKDKQLSDKTAGPGCSKLTTSLVNVLLIFRSFSNMQIFFVEKL